MSPESVHARERRPAAVVSLHKCGVNLLANLLRALGLHPFGPGIRESYAVLASRLRAAGATEAGGQEISDAELVTRHADRLLAWLPGEPDDACLCLHALPAPVLGQRVLPEYPGAWLYLVRDPRARLVSLIGYLQDQARASFSRTEWTLKHQAALTACASDEERIRYVIEALPGYTGQYRTHAWLLDHPAVCVVRFEDLVGAEGGGDAARQQEACRRIARHLGRADREAQRTGSLYQPTARTFRSGQVDGWRGRFSIENLQRFNARYGDVLDTYGYTRDGLNGNGPNHSV